MPKLLSFTLSLIILLTACAPVATMTPAPTRITQPSQTPAPAFSDQSTAATGSSPTEQSQAKPTKKPKGGKAPVAPTSISRDFIAYEITGRPTDTSVTVNVLPAVDMQIYYEYGTASGAYNAQTTPQTAKANTPLETLIDNLQPNTRYYYRINYNGIAGTERTFTTQRAAGSTFTFDIQGDSHPERTKNQFDPDLYTKTLLSAAADLPDFYMTIGDDFSVDTLKEVTPQTVAQLYINQRQWLGLVGAPVFLVNGNHEQASMANLDGTPNNVAVWAQTSRNAYYPQPAPNDFYTGDAEPVEYIGPLRDYYAFTWGDALFVVIDPYWHSPQPVDNEFGAGHDGKKNRDLWNVTLGDTQYQWFKQTLETSDAKYKFVFTHHVLGTGRGGVELASGYEWGDAAHLAAHRPGWDRTIQQIMADNHVTIFFQGHDHIFARQELDGVIYQTLPEPANIFYSWEYEDAYTSGDKFPNSGHIRVTVSPDGITVDYIRSYLDQPDEVAFSCTVK
jgi:hypothetical protein